MHCVVKNCQSIKTRNENSNSKIILHSFPKDQNLRNKWLLILGIREEVFCKNWKVCSLHFSENHYKSPQSLGRKYLNDFAYPTQNLNINNNLYDIKNQHDISIIPSSEIEFENDKFQTNLHGKSEENIGLHRKALQSKPQVVSIFPIPNSSSNEIQEITKLLPEDSISNDFEQNVQDIPKILVITSIEINSPNNSPRSQSPPEESSTFFSTILKPPQYTKSIKRTHVQEDQNKDDKIEDKSILKKRNCLQENKSAIESKIDDQSILNKKTISDSDVKETILKNKDLRDALKERDQKLHALNAKINRNIRRISYMEKTLAEKRLLQLHGY